MKKVQRAISLALAIALSAAMVTGCKSGDSKGSTSTSNTAVKFPLATPTTLTIWYSNSYPGLLGKYPDYSQLPKYKELQKKTNITIKVVTPPIGQEKDQFNLMLASGTQPDIFDMYSVNNYYSGGMQKAYNDGIIVKLNDLQKKYAPDLMKIYQTYKDVDALAKDNDGDYLSVPFIRGQAWMASFAGPVVRKDWLDKLGLSVPETMDDWENMLLQFKNKMGATSPYLMSYSDALKDGGLASTLFTGAYGLGGLDYYVSNGTVKYAASEAKYKDFLTEMAKWYKEGLIDPEFATNNQKTYDAKMLSNKTGAFNGGAGGTMGKFITGMANVDSSAKIEAVPYPTLKKGDTNLFYQTSNAVTGIACISSKCQHKDVAMAYLNYGYTKEGYIQYNFGTEGTSFNWQNGYPTYTNTVTKNSDGLSMANAIQLFAYASGSGEMVQDPRYIEQYYPAQEQKDALKIWTKQSSKVTPANSYLLQGILTSTESSSIASAETQIKTYRDEMLLKFIEGIQPINDSSWNAYITQLKSLGLDNALKVRQTAEDRFKKNNPDFYKAKSFSNPYDLYKDIKK